MADQLAQKTVEMQELAMQVSDLQLTHHTHNNIKPVITEPGFETCFGWDPRHQRYLSVLGSHRETHLKSRWCAILFLMCDWLHDGMAHHRTA